VLAVRFCAAGVAVATGAFVLVVAVVFEFALSAGAQAEHKSASAQKMVVVIKLRFNNLICPPNEKAMQRTSQKAECRNDELKKDYSSLGYLLIHHSAL
jgi:hypothetical protein